MLLRAKNIKIYSKFKRVFYFFKNYSIPVLSGISVFPALDGHGWLACIKINNVADACNNWAVDDGVRPLSLYFPLGWECGVCGPK